MAKKQPILSASLIDTPPVSLTPAQPGRPAVGWDVGRFERLIYDQGYDAYIDRAMRCPCVDKTSGQASSTCQNCYGRGWFFVNRRETRLIAQTMGNRRKYEEWSELNIGTAAITARAVDRMGFMDRVVLLDLEGYFSEILRPTIYRNELFAYPVYEPLEVTDIFLHVADGEPLRPLTTAEFRLDKNRVVFNKDLISMVESNDPNAKVGNLTVSIRYKHYPVYHIIDVDRELMQVREGKPCATRREALTAMPVKVVGRKAEYVFPPMRYGDVPYDNTVK